MIHKRKCYSDRHVLLFFNNYNIVELQSIRPTKINCLFLLREGTQCASLPTLQREFVRVVMYERFSIDQEEADKYGRRCKVFINKVPSLSGNGFFSCVVVCFNFPVSNASTLSIIAFWVFSAATSENFEQNHQETITWSYFLQAIDRYIASDGSFHQSIKQIGLIQPVLCASISRKMCYYCDLAGRYHNRLDRESFLFVSFMVIEDDTYLPHLVAPLSLGCQFASTNRAKNFQHRESNCYAVSLV